VATERTQSAADQKWQNRIFAEHVSPTVVRVFLKLGTTAPAADLTQGHIKACAECASLFIALSTNNASDVVLDYVFEVREGVRQMWSAAERRADDELARLHDKIASLQRVQWWIFVGVLLLVVLRLWPGLFR
jgi:hypothetical protein